MTDNTAQCWCGHERGYHWTGRGCAGDEPYNPQRGTNEPCTCKRFTHWPEKRQEETCQAIWNGPRQ